MSIAAISCTGPGEQAASTQSAAEEAEPAAFVFVGTYTKKEGHVDGKAEGIYTLNLSPEGGLQRAQTEAGIVNPSFLTVDTKAGLLYAVSEIGPDVDSSGLVVAYRINRDDGSLQRLNEQPTHGFAPCYISLSPDGRFAFVANYSGGAIAMYPRLSDGRLGPAADVHTLTGQGPHPEQESAHPHCIIPAPDAPFVYVADKGSDRILIFRLEAEAQRLVPTEQGALKVQAGAGPRHLVFHPKLPRLYLVNELDATVCVAEYSSSDGSLKLLQTITTLPESYEGFNACADIRISPDGKHLYASNRGHNSLAIYEVDETDGRLRPLGHQPTEGDFPRNFALSPDGQWLYAANQNSDNIVGFERNTSTGLLMPKLVLECPTPVCLHFF